jgi:hypothetical protein
VLDRWGWRDVAAPRRNVSCYACQFALAPPAGAGAGAAAAAADEAVLAAGPRVPDSPPVFLYFAPDLDPARARTPPGRAPAAIRGGVRA